MRGRKSRLVLFSMTPQNYTILESSLCSINDCWWPNFQLPKSPPSHFHRSEMIRDLGGVHLLHKQGSSWCSEPKPQRSREAPGWRTISSVMKTSKCTLQSHHVQQWRSSLKFKHERGGKVPLNLPRGVEGWGREWTSVCSVSGGSGAGYFYTHTRRPQRPHFVFTMMPPLPKLEGTVLETFICTGSHSQWRSWFAPSPVDSMLCSPHTI